jgi:hypothetical protein
MSSFFDEASLVMIPSGYKDQKVYSVKPLDGSGDLTFSRASSATRVASNGLIEKVRTNLYTQSNNFTNADWSKVGGVTITGGQADPDGGNNAFLYTRTLAFDYIAQDNAIGVYTVSIYAKANTSNFLRIAGSLGGDVVFNLATGVISSSASATGAIQSLGNGWYRCSANILIATTTHFIQNFPVDNGTSGTGSVFIYEAQLETGDIATDYIATTTAAVSVGPVSGLPRLDYLNSTCPRLLLEPQRTNLVTYSEQFNNPDWSKAETTITANAIASPDGYINADKVEATNTIGNYVNQSSTNTGTYTHSVYAKAGNVSSFTILWASYSSGKGATFNLSNGTATTVGATVTATITNVGNGWYRCTTTDTSANYIVLISLNNPTNTAISIGSYIYLWGAQAESGAYATSYIPTLGTSVTRVADAASKTSASALIGQTEGTIFVEFQKNVGTDAANVVFSLSDGTSSNLIYYNLNSRVIEFIAGGVTVATKDPVILAEGTNKVAVYYKENDFGIYLNGVSIFTDTSGAVPTMSKFNLGCFFNESFPVGTPINQALLFKTRLSNSDLAALTA